MGAFADSTPPFVDHNDAIFVIDAKGRERELVHSDLVLKDFVADLHVLLNER